MRKTVVYVIEQDFDGTKYDTNGVENEKEEELSKFKHLDKGWSYAILFASFCTCCIIGANNYGTGIIHKILLDRYKESVVLTSWSGSLQLALMCLAAPLSSAIIDKYSCRTSVVLSGILFVCGYCATAFVPNMYVAIFTCGVMTGVAAGLGYTASIVVISFNFKKRKQIALGITLSGMGAGIFVLAPLMNQAFSCYGSTGFFIVMASLSANIVTFGALYFPSNLERYTHEQRNQESERTVKGEHIVKLFKKYYTSVLKKPIIILSIATFVFCGGTDLVFLNLPTFVEAKGFSSIQSAMIVSLNGIFSVIGRLVFGFITNIRKINQFWVYSGSLLIVALSIAVYPSVADVFGGHVIFSTILGIFFGCGYLLISPMCTYFVDIHFTSAAIGFVLFFGGAGSIFGPMLAGVMLDNGVTYDICLYTAGGLVLLAAVLGLFISCSYKKYCQKL